MFGSNLLISVCENNWNNSALALLEKTTDINVNDGSVKYLFTNLQYGRCIRDEEIKEIKFNEEHLRDNCDLLVQTILESSHKLYVNWMNIIPITEDDIDTSQLYINTFNLFNGSLLHHSRDVLGHR